MLPVDVQVPTRALFSLPLPPPGGRLSPHSSTGGGGGGGAGGGGGGAASLVVPATPAIAGLHDEVLLMASLMRPKKIVFLGSDGKPYPFLAKPKDDLRKDYRLMDFAGAANIWMEVGWIG